MADESQADRVADAGRSADSPLSEANAPTAAATKADAEGETELAPSAPALAAERTGAASETEASTGSQPLDAGVAPAPTGVAKPGRAASYWFLGVVTVISLAADLLSKAWATGNFDTGQKGELKPFVLINGYLSFIHAKNRGGAWGLLQNENESLRRPFFLIVSVVAIIFIVSLYRKLAPGQTALKWGLPLVLGGALGNLIDRVRFGYVVDFIDMYAKWGNEVKHWPTYNVADIAICIGVGLMAIDMFTPRRKPAAAAAASQPAETVSPPSATTVEPPPAGEALDAHGGQVTRTAGTNEGG